MEITTKKLDAYIDVLQPEINDYIARLDKKKIVEACAVISESKRNHGRVHITGVGKPSHVAEYIAALNSSVGTPTYYLDTTEAIHGSAGQVLPEDVVIAISNSGQTEELKRTVTSLKRLDAKIIGVSGGENSWLKDHSTVFLLAGVNQEGDDLNKPPRISIIAEIIVLQCLSILLQQEEQLDLDKYYQWHPGGALGASIKNIKEVGIK